MLLLFFFSPRGDDLVRLEEDFLPGAVGLLKIVGVDFLFCRVQVVEHEFVPRAEQAQRLRLFQEKVVLAKKSVFFFESGVRAERLLLDVRDEVLTKIPDAAATVAAHGVGQIGLQRVRALWLHQAERAPVTELVAIAAFLAVCVARNLDKDAIVAPRVAIRVRRN